jgi:hypothetical protein
VPERPSGVACGGFSPPNQAGFARLKMEITDGRAIGDTDGEMANRVERTRIKMFMIFQNM